MADKGGFPHYMLKEIFDQPQGLRDTIAPRVSHEEGVVRLDDVRISTDELALCAESTSWLPGQAAMRAWPAST